MSLSTPASADGRKRFCGRCVVVLLSGILVSAVLAAIWIRIEKDHGDTTTVSLREAELRFEESLVFQPDTDGISGIVLGVALSNVQRLSIQPCQEGDAALCELRAPDGETFDADIARSPVEGESRSARAAQFQPAVLIRPSDRNRPPHCMAAATLKSQGGAERSLMVSASEVTDGCNLTLETALVVGPRPNLTSDAGVATSAADRQKTGWAIQIKDGSALLNGNRATRELPLSCPNLVSGAAADDTDGCTIVVDGRGRAAALHGVSAMYYLNDSKDVILLRSHEDAGLVLSALNAQLAAQQSDDLGIWKCTARPGDRWSLTRPSVRRLVLGGDDSAVLRAIMQGHDGVSCRWPWGDFLTRFLGVLGVPAILEIARRLTKCFSEGG